MPPKANKNPSKGKTGWKNQKAKPKAVVPVEDRLKRQFTSLCAQIDGGYFTNAVKTCDKILRLNPSDEDALQTKLFLLLQTEQYDQALQQMATRPDHYAYERAYTLYRMQQEPEARDIIEGLKKEKGNDDRGIVHLEAQLSYRQGSYQEAFDLYNHLLDTAEPNSEEHSDILTNLQASQKHLDFINVGFHHSLNALTPALTSSLETAPPPVQSTLTTAIASAASGPTERDGDDTKRAPKKVRMRRVPAGVVPGVTPPPDPERWLKKSERSTFNQGKRRRGGGGATQGVSLDSVQSTGGSTVHTSKSGGKGKKKK